MPLGFGLMLAQSKRSDACLLRVDQPETNLLCNNVTRTVKTWRGQRSVFGWVAGGVATVSAGWNVGSASALSNAVTVGGLVSFLLFFPAN